MLIAALLVDFDSFGPWQSDGGEEAPDPWPVTFTTGVSLISSIWRSPGVHSKIVKLVAAMAQSDVVASETVPRAPGRCVRTRWGTVHDVIVVIQKQLPTFPLSSTYFLVGR